MANLEQENNMLMVELKKNCKVESVHQRIKSELQAQKADSLTRDQVQTYEKVVRSLKSSTKNLTCQLQKAQS